MRIVIKNSYIRNDYPKPEHHLSNRNLKKNRLESACKVLSVIFILHKYFFSFGAEIIEAKSDRLLS